MLKWALIFAVISLVAGLFGFTGMAAGAAGIAKVLFVLFLLVADLIRRSAAIDWKAALALVPYLLWLGVAGYLNLGIYLLNR